MNYNATRTKLPPAPKFNIKQLWTEPKVTTPSSISTTTASFKEPEACAQDVVCLCLDVSGSMEVTGIAISTELKVNYLIFFKTLVLSTQLSIKKLDLTVSDNATNIEQTLWTS